MKQFLSALLLLTLIGCNRQNIVITVDFPDQPEVDTLIYSLHLSGTTMCLGFADTLKANDETGKFELNLKRTKPSFVTIWSKDGRDRIVKLLVESGNNYQLSMDALKNVQITGANEMGQMLYATLPDPEYVESELSKWLRDTVSIISVHHQINELKQADLSKFKELLDSKKITKSFFDLVQKDRDCYYASLEARFLLIKTYYEPIRYGMKINDDLFENLENIYSQYPPNDVNLLFSSFWFEYARLYITEYKEFIQEEFDSQKFQDLRKAGTFHTYVFTESKKHLSGKTLESFQAKYINFQCGDFGSVEKELISLFEQFEKDYPKSEYSKYLKPYIDKLIDYHRISEQPFDPAMLFMDNYETINSLEEAVKPLQGKKIYIDVWASWCSPCKEEFKHNEALKKILAENDIQQLYISIDRDNADQQWKNAIKYYHLTGTHIRANKELYDNLAKLYSQDDPHLAIPWHILIDEKGNMVEKYAKSPSKLIAGEKLFAND